MTLYDEYRRDNPINPEPSEFRDIVEAEVKRALAWRGNLVGVKKWTEADYEVAKELMAPLFDMIAEYESLHYPIAEPSKEDADAFRREQEEPLPAEEIKPGRGACMDKTLKNIRESLITRSAPDAYFLVAVMIDFVDIIRYMNGATFQAVEEG